VTALVVPVVVVAVVSENGTVTARRTRTVIVSATGIETGTRIGTVRIRIGIGIGIAGIETATCGTRIGMTIVAAGVPTASAAFRQLLTTRKMTSLGLHVQAERVKTLACLLSMRIRAKKKTKRKKVCFVAFLVSICFAVEVWFCVWSRKISDVSFGRVELLGL